MLETSAVPSKPPSAPRRAKHNIFRAVLGGLGPWALALLFLGPFLLYPMVRVLSGALVEDSHFAPALLLQPLRNSSLRDAMWNSFVLGVVVTVLASLLAFPLAYASARLNFRGKTLLT